MTRPTIEVNILVYEDATARHVEDLAEYLVEGDGLNISANGYVIRCIVRDCSREKVTS